MEKDTAHNKLQWTIKKGRAHFLKKNLMIKKKSTAQLRTSLAEEKKNEAESNEDRALKVPGSCRRGL